MFALVRRLTAEDAAVLFFGASFFVGIWYALPMVNTITDVWPFGGGVLRAMEAHTLLPGYGVNYGTLSFYLNYAFMTLALAAGYVFSGFDFEVLKTALIQNPSYSLLVPRFVSALTAGVFLLFVHRFLKAHVHSVWWRLALLMLVFGNVLAVLLARSGKMWMLSIGLGTVSFIYLYRSLREEASGGRPSRLAFTSVITAFLATANFPFAAVYLVNIPVLFYVFPRTYDSLKPLAYAVALGGALLIGVFALNAGNTIAQVSGFILPLVGIGVESAAAVRLTYFESFIVNARQAIEAFPLLLLALVAVARSGIRDKTLAYLSLLYAAVYIIAVSVVFTSDDGLALNVRHIFPLGFFLTFLLAAFEVPRRWVSGVFLGVGFLIYIYAVALLSVPATYNSAYDYVVATYGNADIRIDEHIFEMTLPMNKASYGLFMPASCGSACEHLRAARDDIAFNPLVVTDLSDPKKAAALPPPDIIVTERAIPGCVPLARFGNAVRDDEIFDIDINLGRMLMPSFYRLRQLGKNVYVYDGTCTQTVSFWPDTAGERQ